MSSDWKKDEYTDSSSMDSRYLERIKEKTQSLQIDKAKDEAVMIAQTGIKLNKWLNAHYKECYFKWIPEDTHFDQQEVRYYIKNMDTKFSSISPEWDLQQLKMDPFTILCHKLSKIFCLIVVGDWGNATRLLTEAKENIDIVVEEGFMHQRYQQGFHYLRQGLEAFKISVMPEEDEQEIDLESYLGTFIRYDDLKDETLPVLKAAKAYFYVTIRYSYDAQIKLFQELCYEDPEQIFWKIRLYTNLRQKRRTGDPSFHCYPTDKEKDILVECLESEPNFLWVIDAVIQYLIDVVTTRWWNENQWPIRLTENLEFRNYDDIQDYVKRLTERTDIQTILEYSVLMNLRFAKLVTGLLKHIPGEQQDPGLIDLRLKCFNTALTMKPDWSKVNHRVGNFYHTVENKLDVALQFYRKAYDCDPRNYPAIIDLASSLMGDIDGNREELENLFEKCIEEKHWSDPRRASLLFEYGIFLFMGGKYVKCLESWERAHTLKRDVMRNLKFLPIHSRRYGWDCNLIDTGKVKAVLEDVMKCDAREFAQAGLVQLAEISKRQRNSHRDGACGNGGNQNQNRNDGAEAPTEKNWRVRNENEKVGVVNEENGKGSWRDNAGGSRTENGRYNNRDRETATRYGGNNAWRNYERKRNKENKGNNFNDPINQNWRVGNPVQQARV